MKNYMFVSSILFPVSYIKRSKLFTVYSYCAQRETLVTNDYSPGANYLQTVIKCVLFCIQERSLLKHSLRCSYWQYKNNIVC